MRYWTIDKYILTKGYINMKDKHEFGKIKQCK